MVGACSVDDRDKKCKVLTRKKKRKKIRCMIRKKETTWETKDIYERIILT
jgi:hypothetical protein